MSTTLAMELPVLVQEGAYNPNHTDTAIHALDEDNDPLCGINPDSTEPWFELRLGAENEVTCEGCRAEMDGDEGKWDNEEEEPMEDDEDEEDEED